MTFDTKVEFEREPQFGRPYVWTEDGKRLTYTRCTTYVDALDEKYQLSLWQQRMVAVGMSQRKDLLTGIAAIAHELMLPSDDVPKEAKAKANLLCEAALEAAQGKAGATLGTALHSMTETIDRGGELGVVPTEIQPDLDAYVAATAPLTALHIEQPMVLDALQIGGTPDRLVELGGTVYVADLKTGSIEFSALKIAMQLAVYAHSTLYDPVARKRIATPPIDQQRAIVIHLPVGKGKCELRWCDIGRAWDAVDVARQVREWRRTKGWLTPVSWDQPLPLPGANLAGGPEAAQELQHRLADAVAQAASVEALVTLWATNRDVWGDELTELATARKVLIQQGVVA